MLKRLGKFGTMVKDYEKARRPYPVEVFRIFKKYLPTESSLILDLGCGTGISTRQLAKIGKVIGCDPDPLMLQAARKHKRVNNERYLTGSAEKLPFKNETFQAVTAFASFHWFNNTQSINEIKRVLRPGGIFLVVNKIGARSWGEGYRGTIIKTIGKEIANFKEDSYNPAKSLSNYKFKKIITQNFRRSELFTIKNALEYVQSVSIWNSVNIASRAMAVEGLKKYFKTMLKNKGKIERKLVVKVVIAAK